ncbi:MAG: autotransporter-associated beta strand repeat-containing protein, partial [Sphingobium sp.]
MKFLHKVAMRAVSSTVKSAKSINRKTYSKALLLALASSTMLVPAAVRANSLVLSGDYIKIGLNDRGTLGYNGNTSPGILYDGTGSGTFNTAYDYLTPGSPFEGFVISGTNGTTFSKNNNNSGASAISGSLVDYSGIIFDGATYDNRAVWTGTVGGVLSVTNDYFFNADSQKIGIRTTISALTDLSALAFSRQIDPDAQAAPGDSSATTNIRGADGVAASDLVYAEALVSKYVIGLYTNSTVTHNSAVTGWTSDTASYISGANIGNGDNTIGLGFDIGALLTGQSVVLDYSYIFGTDIAAAIGGPNNITGTRTVAELLAGAVNPVFDGGTLAFTTPLTLSTALSLEAGGGTIDTQGNDATISGVLSGVGALTKAGEGTLTLSGANSYTGGTTVSGGRLVGDTASLQGAIVNNAIVEFAQVNDGSYASTISGSGSLVKSGSGTLTLSGANSYAGGTTVSGGRLVGDTASLQGAIVNNAIVEFAQVNDG